MNTPPVYGVRERDELEFQVQSLLETLGDGRVDGVAYDTAWAARLALRYPSHGFEKSVDWLRRHQYTDGTWGAPLVHYHDRYISTLAAIVALQEALKEGNGHPRDIRRVKRGEDALWRLVGKLGRDDSDTVGFPILSAALTEEASELGLDVPQAPIRFAGAYQKKVRSLLEQPQRDWYHNTLSFSLEALRYIVSSDDVVLSGNGSVAVSPSATAGYLLVVENDKAIEYLTNKSRADELGAISALSPIDTFEVIWSLNHLITGGVVNIHSSNVQSLIEWIHGIWRGIGGMNYSSHFLVPDIDMTAAANVLLTSAGIEVDLDVYLQYEKEDHFFCYIGETNPSMSAHVRLISALRAHTGDRRVNAWIQKATDALRKYDDNGSFWWDKWHSSPYYVNSTAINALHGIADDLVSLRLKWIIRTQNDDGGWGYFEHSTPEETAYCLLALSTWVRNGGLLDQTVLDRAASFLYRHIDDTHFTPLWIGKSLYTPHFPVKSAILTALFSFSQIKSGNI